MKSFVECNKVFVYESTFKGAGLGAFAACDLKAGEIVEIGVARVIACDGNEDPFLFTWSDDRTRWAFCSGCAPFYNTSLEPNTTMKRDFEQNTFVITANRDIAKGEELTHKYRSLQWRQCFSGLHAALSHHV